MLVGLPSFMDYDSSFTADAKSVSDYQKEKQAAQKKAQEAKDRLNKLKKEKASQEKILDAIRAKRDATQKEINLCNAQLAALKKEIAGLEDLIKKTDAELEESKQLFAERVRALYISGGNAGLEILMGANDFADYLMKAEMLSCVTKQDTALMDELTKKIETIKKSKASVEEKKAAQDAVYRELAAKQAQIKAELSEEAAAEAKIQSSINSANYDLKLAQEAEKRAQKEIDELYRQAQQGPLKVFASGFAWPTQGSTYISSYFGPRWGSYHYGLDISGGGFYGRPILASAAGTVVTSKFDSGYGYYITINHGTKDGKIYMTRYAHCSKLLVSVGATVKQGQVIAYAGSTGNSTGPHLHFEIIINGSRVNPLPYLR